MCVRRFHYTCEALKLSQLEFLSKYKDNVAYTCKECAFAMGSYLGKFLSECQIYLREIVSGNEKNISLVVHRLKAVGQFNNYEENIELPKAVEKI